MDSAMPEDAIEWMIAVTLLLSLLGIFNALISDNKFLLLVIVLTMPVLVGGGLLWQRYVAPSSRH